MFLIYFFEKKTFAIFCIQLDYGAYNGTFKE